MEETTRERGTRRWSKSDFGCHLAFAWSHRSILAQTLHCEVSLQPTAQENHGRSLWVTEQVTTSGNVLLFASLFLWMTHVNPSTRLDIPVTTTSYLHSHPHHSLLSDNFRSHNQWNLPDRAYVWTVRGKMTWVGWWLRGPAQRPGPLEGSAQKFSFTEAASCLIVDTETENSDRHTISFLSVRASSWVSGHPVSYVANLKDLMSFHQLLTVTK